MTMKRKLQVEINEDNKMLKLNQSSSVPEPSEVNSGRKFDFELTDKKAKANLMKSASRAHLEVEKKQRSTNLKFSAGAYLLVAKPFVKKCELGFLNKTPFIEKDMEISVEEYRDGLDQNNKHFDTKIVFSINRKKVVIHCYNSTQNMKVDGSIYEYFIEKFLVPFFKTKIGGMFHEISEYDKTVFATLAARGRPIRPRSVKSVRSVINQSNFTCKRCCSEFVNHNQLKKHKLSVHSTSFNTSETSLMSIRNSTRNNSFVEDMLLCDDISLSVVKNTLEEDVVKDTLEKDVIKDTLKEDVKSHNIPQVNHMCEKCEKIFDCITNLETHKCVTHKNDDVLQIQPSLESIFSCEKCDFESENEEDMKTHNTKNIHDIRNMNKTVQEDGLDDCNSKSYKCHKCDFNTSDLKVMDEHTVNIHGMFKCYKCEYIAEDHDLLKNHMKKHTGRILFTCSGCEFEATRQILLENHMEVKHKKKSDRNNKCDDCGKTFPALFLSRYHICGPQYTYPCQMCKFVAIDLEEITYHMVEYHTNSLSILSCDQCDFKSIKSSNIEIHKQTNHKNLKVDIKEEDLVQFQCDECKYKCTLNIKLKKHKTKHHGSKDTGRFKCNNCEFSSDLVLHMWEHRLSNHPENMPQLVPKPKGIALALLAEQGYDIMEEIISMKSGLANSFKELVAFVHSNTEEVKSKVSDNFKATQTSLENLDKKIDSIAENVTNIYVEKLNYFKMTNLL